MLSRVEVTPCLVTRGDQPEMMNRIIDTLIFDELIVWNNSVRPDWKTAGRYMAAAHARTDWVYFQDDDVLVSPSTQAGLLDAVLPTLECVATDGHGPDPAGYEDMPLVGGGAIVNRRAVLDAIARYGAKYPLDSAFMYEADFAVGALYETWLQVDLPFHIDLSIAQDPSRLCNQPWQPRLKKEIADRARRIRG